MSKKVAMFSNGLAVINEDGQTRKASEQEVKDYLVSIVPQKKAGAELEGVRYEDGFVYAKYSDNKVFRKKVAQSNVRQTEPVNSVDKSDPKVKVPRNESKAKPTIDVDRPDVGSPTEVRKDNYERGKGGDDLHKGIPRSKSNGGLEGGSNAPVAEEKANKATSGNPDSYVQKFKNSEKPAAAGSEKNHAASSDVTIKSEAEIYSKISIAESEDPKAENNIEKEAKSKLPPWLEKGKKDDDEDSKEKKDEDKEAKLQVEIKTAQNEVKQLKAELNKVRVREARQKSAIKLALAYRDINPEKYASVESVGEKIDEIASKMDVTAIETALEEIKVIRTEAMKHQSMVKEASNDGGLATVLASFTDDASSNFEGLKEIARSKNKSVHENLKDILMQHTALGRKVAEFASYTPHVKE